MYEIIVIFEAIGKKGPETKVLSVKVEAPNRAEALVEVGLCPELIGYRIISMKVQWVK